MPSVLWRPPISDGAARVSGGLHNLGMRSAIRPRLTAVAGKWNTGRRSRPDTGYYDYAQPEAEAARGLGSLLTVCGVVFEPFHSNVRSSKKHMNKSRVFLQSHCFSTSLLVSDPDQQHTSLRAPRRCVQGRAGNPRARLLSKRPPTEYKNEKVTVIFQRDIG